MALLEAAGGGAGLGGGALRLALARLAGRHGRGHGGRGAATTAAAAAAAAPTAVGGLLGDLTLQRVSVDGDALGALPAAAAAAAVSATAAAMSAAAFAFLTLLFVLFEDRTHSRLAVAHFLGGWIKYMYVCVFKKYIKGWKVGVFLMVYGMCVRERERKKKNMKRKK